MRYLTSSQSKASAVVALPRFVASPLLETLAMLNADGIEPTIALCVIDRESGAEEALLEQGLELRPLFTMSDIENS